MKRAFSLIELLVATVLMAMLVTILTMVFNQSSIAWTTGIASVVSLGDAREKISIYSRSADNVILDDRGETLLRIVSVWNDEGSGGLKQTSEGGVARTLEKLDDAEDMNKTSDKIQREQLEDYPYQDKVFNVGGATPAGRQSFVVGVTSYGPDGETGGDKSWDDISTLPEVIVK